MAAQDITRLMSTARVRLPGATDQALQLELFSVMDEFFKGSNVWQEDITFTVPGNDPAGTVYDIVSTAPSLIDKLMWVFQQPTDANQRPSVPVAAAMSTPGELTLRTQPSSPVSYIATVALTVLDPTNRDGYVSFPAWVLARYRAVILDGLLGRMMTQPNKPFTNSQLAIYHLRKFVSGISAARVDVTRNNTYRQQAWRFPAFSGGSQRGRGGWANPQ